MRILVIAPEFEDTNYRGIQFNTKQIIKAFSVIGHQVILLTSHPPVQIKVRSKRLRERVLNTYFRQYLYNGARLNGKMAQYRKGIMGSEMTSPQSTLIVAARIVMTFVTSLVRRLVQVPVDKSQMSGIPLVQYIDSTVNLPYFYRLANAMPRIFRRIALEKAARAVKADVIFVSFPLMIPKLKSAKVVQVIYDLIPFEIAEEPVELEWLPKVAAKIDYVIAHTDLLFTNSEDSQRKILEIAPNAAPHIFGGAISAFPEEIAEFQHDSGIINTLGLQKGKFVVFISSVEKRKNVHRLIRAFLAIANKTAVKLVIAGNKAVGFEEIYQELSSAPEEIRQRVIFTGYVSEADKYTLLRHARALINPTLYEGIGIPVLEAFAVGCPVVASYVGALVEVGGDAMYKIFDPYSISEIGQALLEIVEDDSLCKELVKKGHIQAAKFTEEIFREKIKKGLQKLEGHHV